MKIEDVRPGMWVRDTLAPYMGPAFVTGLEDGGFNYHLAFPWPQHVAIAAWQTGGTVFANGVEHWEPTNDPRDSTGSDSDPR